MAKDQHGELRLRILTDQLERAHATVARCQDARRRVMNGGALVMLALLLLSYTKWVTMSALALPFVAIYLVVQCGYFTHLLAAYRAHVAALEDKINAEVGETLLLGEVVETSQQGQPGQPHFLGVSTIDPTGLFSATMLHYLILCAIVFVAGWLRSNFILGSEELIPVRRLADVYVPILILWTVINVGYLLWFFLASEKEKGVVTQIRGAYQTKKE